MRLSFKLYHIDWCQSYWAKCIFKTIEANEITISNDVRTEDFSTTRHTPFFYEGALRGFCMSVLGNQSAMLRLSPLSNRCDWQMLKKIILGFLGEGVCVTSAEYGIIDEEFLDKKWEDLYLPRVAQNLQDFLENDFFSTGYAEVPIQEYNLRIAKSSLPSFDDPEEIEAFMKNLSSRASLYQTASIAPGIIFDEGRHIASWPLESTLIPVNADWIEVEDQANGSSSYIALEELRNLLGDSIEESTSFIFLPEVAISERESFFAELSALKPA